MVIQWDGCWVTDEGEVLPIDHRRDWHHVDIAWEQFGDECLNDDGERDEYGEDAANSMALDSGWVRIGIHDTETGVEFYESTTEEALEQAWSYLVRARPTDIYRVNNGDPEMSRGRFLASIRAAAAKCRETTAPEDEERTCTP